jgi:hypothetical protein
VAVRVAELTQGVPKRVKRRAGAGGRRSRAEDTDSRDLARLLPLGGERRGEEGASYFPVQK